MADEVYEGAIGIDLGKYFYSNEDWEIPRVYCTIADLFTWIGTTYSCGKLLEAAYAAAYRRCIDEDTNVIQLPIMRAPMLRSLPTSKVLSPPHPSSPSPTRSV